MTAALTRLRHRGDPTTSLHAARRLVDEGRLAPQLSEILDMVRSNPGRTTLELSELEGCRLDRYTIAKRMSLLEESGMVRRGAARVQANGRSAHEYYPGAAQAVLL